MTRWDPRLMAGHAPDGPVLLRNFVNGSFVDAGPRFTKRSPVTGEPVFEVVEASASVVDDAVAAARAALHGPWGRLGERERAEVLRRVADELERRFDDLVAAEVADTGKSISQARTLDIPRGAANFRAFAEIVATAPTAVVHHGHPDRRPGAELRGSQAGRRGRGDRAVEPAAAPAHLEGRPRPGLRQRGGGQAQRGDPGLGHPARRGDGRRGRAGGRVQSWCTASAPSRPGSSSPEQPGVDAITFTGESATGSAIMRAAADAGDGGHASSWAARTPASSSPTPTWTRRSPGRCGPASPTPARSACAPSGSTCSGRSSRSSPPGWPSAPTSWRTAGRPTRPRSTGR